MRSILAVIVALGIFVVMWLLVAGIIAAMAWAGTAAGVRPGLFLFLNIFLVWILSPGMAAALAIFASTSHFTEASAHTIFVAFVSVCSVVLIAILGLSLVGYSLGRSPFWHIFLLAAQAGSIFGGARIGFALTPSRAPHENIVNTYPKA